MEEKTKMEKGNRDEGRKGERNEKQNEVKTKRKSEGGKMGKQKADSKRRATPCH